MVILGERGGNPTDLGVEWGGDVSGAKTARPAARGVWK